LLRIIYYNKQAYRVKGKVIDKYITLNYHPRLIKLMMEFTFAGVFAANIIAPLLACFVAFEYIPHTYLALWVFAHILVFLSRIIVNFKLSYSIKHDKTKKTKKLLAITFCLVFISAFLYGVFILIGIIYDMPNTNILLIAMVSIAISAGAISTLGSIYTAFLIYVLTSMLPLLVFMLYLGGKIFNVFTFVIFVFTFIILKAGYRHYTILKNSVYLEETFRTIYEKSSDGIIIIKNEKFLDCNESILKMMRCKTKDEFLKLDITELSPKFQPDGSKSQEKANKFMQVAFERGFNSFEWLHSRYDGEEFWAEIVLTKIYLNGENLLHVVMRDVSKRKENEQMIKELNHNLEEKVDKSVRQIRKKEAMLETQHRSAQMGEMMSMIAHQWRQPLSAISSISSAINLKANLNKLDKETVIKLANQIISCTKHLSETIDDFRDFFKPNSGVEETNYEEMVNSIVGIVEDTIKDKKIELIQDLKCNQNFKTYKNEVKQVVLNLIKNAEDILMENKVQNPYIKVQTYVQDDEYILEVRDNGGGVPSEIIHKIYEPYFSTKEKRNGTGLGLYMSRKIVEDHCKGTLSVSNDDEGAIFKICLKGI
jgi:PAS domain S-box-containing protein